MFHSETRIAFIYFVKSQPLRFDDRTEPYRNYGFISIIQLYYRVCLVGFTLNFQTLMVSQISAEVFLFYFLLVSLSVHREQCFPDASCFSGEEETSIVLTKLLRDGGEEAFVLCS